jgi:hypothetical protein
MILLSPKPKPKPKNGIYYNAYTYRRLFYYHHHYSTTITAISIEEDDRDIWICSFCGLRSDRHFIKDHILTCPKKNKDKEDKDNYNHQQPEQSEQEVNY